jgi:polyisoprenoid-binding protein YceI
MRALVSGVLAGILALATLGDARATTYVVDPNHTSVGFRVKHLFTYVDGRFTKFTGTVEFDPSAPEKTKVSGTVDVASIDTNVEKRDTHLRSADFFDVAKYPTLRFTSTGVTDVDAAAGTAKLHGNLTIRDVTKPVVLDAKFLGAATDPWGNRKAGFSGTTTINRKDFGLSWNQALETGGVLVGEQVEIRIDVEGGVED